MVEIERKFLFEIVMGIKPDKLNENNLFIQPGRKYSIAGYSPRPGFYGDYYIIYCKDKKSDIITAFCSNTKISKKITEYRMGLDKETPILEKRGKELYEMNSPIKFTLGEIKKFEGKKNITYREIFFK